MENAERTRMPFEPGLYRARRKRALLSPIGQAKVNQFHDLYYRVHCSVDANGGPPGDSSWLGHQTLKNPFDLMTYQEIIVECRPDLIIETGTKFGGSALYFASIFDLVGHGQVVTVDIDATPGRPIHPRITYLHGSSTNPAIVARIQRMITAETKVMVILDSDHRKPHVDAELGIYPDLVTLGQYLIVEDTNINGHPVFPEFGPGPQEAMQEFLRRDSRFAVDRERERHFLTYAPNGFLRRT